MVSWRIVAVVSHHHGMLASFFGKLAGYPVSVMETECRSAGGDQCRFLLGNSEVMAYRWEKLR
jgi:hypothetical protein